MIQIPTLFLAILAFTGGMLLITWGADALLDGIADLSQHFSTSPLILAFLVMGIDLEETIASVGGALRGLPELAIGNVIGNSIISICFCFALPALFFTISLKKIKKIYFLFLGGLAGIVMLTVLFPPILLWSGIFSICLYGAFIWWNMKHIKKDGIGDTEGDEINEPDKNSEIETRKLPKIVGITIFATLILFVGTNLLLSGTEFMLTFLGWEEAFFGVVVIAAATNIEEYVLLIRSVQKHHSEIGLGALLGKIIWNLSMTFGLSALIIGGRLPHSPLLVNNAILLTGILVPSLILLNVSRKDLNWRWGVFYLCIFLLFLLINLLMHR